MNNNSKKIVTIISFLFVFVCFIVVVVVGSLSIRKLKNELEDNINNSKEYIELINEVSLETIKANVMIYTTCYNKTPIFGIPTEQATGQGSGVIFQETATEYYVLTNNHVVYLHDGYTLRRFQVIDYLGNEYVGTLIYADPDYDLGVIRFSKKATVLKALEFSNENPKEQDVVISLGQPHGQSNTITLGNVLQYTKVNLQNSTPESSNVTFSVIHHNAPINSGSSGGVLLNKELKIVGINYAGSENEDGTVANNSFAIPLEKIQEFLTNIN